MTGQYPARLHLTDFIAGQNRPYARMLIPDWTKRLDSSHTTIAEVLKTAGYRTAHIGKWHLSDKSGKISGTTPLKQGFDVSKVRPPRTRGYTVKPRAKASDTQPKYLTDVLTDDACEFIDESKDDPFFLYFAYHVPHTPIEGRPDLVKAFKAKVKPGAVHTNPEYAAMVASLDQSVGRIIERLAQNELTDNAVVIFISDNGGLTQRYGKHDGFTENLPLRRGKGSAYEGGVRVPAIAFWPGITTPGSTCDEPIITTDLFPTLAEIARAKLPESTAIDGQSLVPLFNDTTHKFDRNLFWHYPHYHAGGDGPYSAIRSGDFRLIVFHEDQQTRLYNLANDIEEKTDLSQTHPQKLATMKRQLQEWQSSVGAQMPTPNPDYDPARQTNVAKPKPQR